jgi:hypothetical protein
VAHLLEVSTFDLDQALSQSLDAEKFSFMNGDVLVTRTEIVLELQRRSLPPVPPRHGLNPSEIGLPEWFAREALKEEAARQRKV